MGWINKIGSFGKSVVDNTKDAAKNIGVTFGEADAKFKEGDVRGGLYKSALGTLATAGNAVTLGGANAVGRKFAETTVGEKVGEVMSEAPAKKNAGLLHVMRNSLTEATKSVSDGIKEAGRFAVGRTENTYPDGLDREEELNSDSAPISSSTKEQIKEIAKQAVETAKTGGLFNNALAEAAIAAERASAADGIIDNEAGDGEIEYEG